MGLFDRLTQKPPKRSYVGGSYVDVIANHGHPMARLWGMRGAANNAHSHSPYMGVMPGGNLLLADPQTHLLAIGPPQGNIGKSSAVAATNAVAHFGPEVVVTTKWDLVRAVALPRHFVNAGGGVWQYNPAGAVDEGFTELRWSPLTICSNDEGTRSTVQGLMDAAIARNRMTTSVGTGGESAAHFAELARPLVGGLIRYAAAHSDGGKPLTMRWIGDQLAIKSTDALGAVAEWLESVGSVFASANRGYSTPGQGGREVHSIFTTAQIIFEPWMTEAAIASMTDPNFVPEDFVKVDWQPNPWLRDNDALNDPQHPNHGLAVMGIHPTTGIFETVIMSIDSQKQALAAPLVMSLLDAITAAAIRQSNLDERAGHFGRPNVGLILDELANLAPLPALPSLLSQGASQGVTVYGFLQTASQSLHLWGDRQGGHAMLSNFRNVILMPGVTDPYTLEWFEKMGGLVDRPVLTDHIGSDGRTSTGRGFDRVPRFPIDVLREGHHTSTDLCLCIGPGGGAMDWMYGTPVHRARPWRELLLETFVRAVRDPAALTRGDEPTGLLLPPPNLDRDRTGRHLEPRMREDFWDAMTLRDQLLAEYRAGVRHERVRSD